MAGNKNSGRRQEKPFADALRLEIANAKTPRRLRKIAKTLLDKAQAGNMQAMSLLLERLDGKVPQAIDQEVSVTVDRIERVFIDAPSKVIDADPVQIDQQDTSKQTEH